MVGGSRQTSEEALEKDVREVMSVISHNLRTPLAVIKGCTDMLLSHGEEQLDEARRRELLLAASSNVDRLADAISWLEERIDELAKGRTIRLPDDASPPDA